MRGLGSLVLASVLLGVPRALEARAFGAQRSVYVELLPGIPELAGFAAALERALGEAGWSLAPRPTEATMVVDVLSVATGRDARGRPIEAIGLAVHDRRGLRRLVLQGAAWERAATARQLLARLSPAES